MFQKKSLVIDNKKQQKKLPKMSEEIKGKIISFFSVVIFIIIWQYLSANNIIDPFFTGIPSEIFREGIIILRSGELTPYLLHSFHAFIWGFGLAIIFGLVFGIIIGLNKTLYSIMYPFIYTIDALPRIVIIPLLIIWIGIGIEAKIVMIFLMSFMPILINVIYATINTNYNLITMSKSFGAKGYFKIKNIYLYSVLPSFFSAVRISRATAIIGLVVAEFFGLGKGIGYLISFYGAIFRTNTLLFLIFILLLFNFFLLFIIYKIEKRMYFYSNR